MSDVEDTNEVLALDDLIHLMFSDGEWVRFPVRLTRLLSLHEVVMFSELFNRSYLCRKDRKLKGWFQYSVSQIEERINFSEYTQRRTIDSLEEKGLIRSERRGSPPFRYIKIDSKAVCDFLNRCGEPIPAGSLRNAENTGESTTCTNVQTQRILNSYPKDPKGSTTNGKRTIKEQSPPSGKVDDSRLEGFNFDNSEGNQKPPKDNAYLLSEKLYIGLANKGKISTGRPKLANWAIEIRKFLALPGRSEEAFEKLMEEYLARIDEEFMPIAYSASSFCEKFPKIEVALRRNSRNGSDAGDDQIARILKKRFGEKK